MFVHFVHVFVTGEQLSANHPEAIGQSGTLFAFKDRDRSQSIFAANAVCRVVLPPGPND